MNMHYRVCFILKAATEVSLDSPGWDEAAVCMTECSRDSGLLGERRTVLDETVHLSSSCPRHFWLVGEIGLCFLYIRKMVLIFLGAVMLLGL